MARKLYALFILIGAIGALVLVYLYFFVYYTAVLTVNSNVSDYSVQLYSPSTAQKWIHECPEAVCVIPDVSPFEYNISISKEDYVTKTLSAKIGARGKESLVIELEKKVFLESLVQDENQETNKQKIKRLREEKLFYARFQLDEDVLLVFQEDGDQLLLRYKTKDNIRDIEKFELVKKDDIYADSISQTENIFLQVGEEKYIFDTQKLKLTRLPFQLPISYIKKGNSDKKYLIITEKGSFVYDVSDDTSSYQYLFKDFLYLGEKFIGIVYDDEEEKKSNFNLTQEGNLIIKYSPEDKTRKVVEVTKLSIDRLEWRGEKIIFSSKGSEYELKNFD